MIFKKRERWIDIARGLAIFFIVLGHSDNIPLQHYMYWFNAPAFFVISGLLFKPVHDWTEFKDLARRRFTQLIIPYLFFLLIVTVYRYILIGATWEFTWPWLMQDISRLILGGRFLTGFYSFYRPVWFLTCLFITHLGFALLLMLVKIRPLQIVILVAFYLLAHFESRVEWAYELWVPFNLDVALITMSFFATGYYLRNLVKKINYPILGVLILFVAYIFYLDYTDKIWLGLNVAALFYKHPWLDYLIPVSIALIILKAAMIIDKAGWGRTLTYIGSITIAIMLWHGPVNLILLSDLHLHYNYIFYTLIGFIAPILLVRYVIQRYEKGQKLFLGKILNPSWPPPPGAAHESQKL